MTSSDHDNRVRDWSWHRCVVELEPWCKGVGTFGVGSEDPAVGPLGLQGAVESLDFAVLPAAGFRSIGGGGRPVVDAEHRLLEAGPPALLSVARSAVTPAGA